MVRNVQVQYRIWQTANGQSAKIEAARCFAKSLVNASLELGRKYAQAIKKIAITTLSLVRAANVASREQGSVANYWQLKYVFIDIEAADTVTNESIKIKLSTIGHGC
jgi:hypothetical protein